MDPSAEYVDSDPGALLGAVRAADTYSAVWSVLIREALVRSINAGSGKESTGPVGPQAIGHFLGMVDMIQGSLTKELFRRYASI